MHDSLTTPLSTGTEIHRRAMLAMLGGLGASSLLPSALLAEATKSPARYAHVAKVIEQYVNAGRVPGIIAALGTGTDPEALRYVKLGTLAFNSKTKLDLDSLWRIYSMTKPITGMATMKLIGEGKLKLDQPVADFIPEFAEMTVAKDPIASLDAVPAKTQITIRHLITHSSGLGYILMDEGALSRAFRKNGLTGAPLSNSPLAAMLAPASAPSLKVFAERLAKLPLIAEPGTKWSYSAGLDLMGRVIEIVTGKSFDSYLEEDFLKPIGMTSTWFKVPKSEAARMSTNYFYFGDAPLPVDPGANSVFFDNNLPQGGGGLVSSARDYDRFLTMLLNKGRMGDVQLIKPDMVALGMSNLLPEGVNTKGTLAEGQGFGAGGRVGIGANAGEYGWAGAAGTIGGVNTRTNMRMGLYTQYMPVTRFDLRSDFTAALMKDLAAAL